MFSNDSHLLEVSIYYWQLGLWLKFEIESHALLLDKFRIKQSDSFIIPKIWQESNYWRWLKLQTVPFCPRGKSVQLITAFCSSLKIHSVNLPLSYMCCEHILYYTHTHTFFTFLSCRIIKVHCTLFYSICFIFTSCVCHFLSCCWPGVLHPWIMLKSGCRKSNFFIRL